MARKNTSRHRQTQQPSYITVKMRRPDHEVLRRITDREYRRAYNLYLQGLNGSDDPKPTFEEFAASHPHAICMVEILGRAVRHYEKRKEASQE